MRAHVVPPRRGQARGKSHHLPVPRLALRRALRAVLGCARAQDRHLCHQGRGRQGPRGAEGGVTMTDEVIVYALSTCPWCRKTKQWFTDSRIEFQYVDVDRLELDPDVRAPLHRLAAPGACAQS